MRQENLASGARGFDSIIGTWNVHNRRKKGRTTGEENEWEEFTGRDTFEWDLERRAVIEHYDATLPDGARLLGLSIKAFDPETQEWSIIWIDNRNTFDFRPLCGTFTNGVGTFYQVIETPDGKPLHVRYIWDEMTATSARWQQAFSFDEGENWDTNWIMHFTAPTRV